MIEEATLIFPHQLFENNQLIEKNRLIILVEDERFFTDFNFHKHKLILHRASMQAYYAELKKKKYKVQYLDSRESKKLFSFCKKNNIKKLHYFDPVDIPLENRLRKQAAQYAMTLCSYETPMFLSEQAWLNDYFADKETFFMASFYKDQRKRLNILMTKKGAPLGGSWSYDKENRKKIPADCAVPAMPVIKHTIFVKEAIEYVQKRFKKNPGSAQSFWFATTHSQAKTWLKHFLKYRLAYFGTYQDAIVKDGVLLYHSALSAYLNCGLLTPDYVLQHVLTYAQHTTIPLNSLEGFVRQLIGWREFVRAVYVFKGTQERRSNFWKHSRKIPPSLWNASTGIMPVDSTIQKVIDHAYVHHIERLMIMGNFMLLCEFDPNDVYTWFMELHIDAYDWVMVPNVYGMSQYADGGLFATKPYISSSQYIVKMSDFEKGPWCTVWNALYWRFINKHKNYFASLGRLAIMNYQLQRMPKSIVHQQEKIAEKFLQSL